LDIAQFASVKFLEEVAFAGATFSQEPSFDNTDTANITGLDPKP